MAYGLGVSPRRLLGWEPTETTTYEYDSNGVLVSSVTVREPEFDKEQYELLTALVEYEASLGDHGHPLEETMSPLADPDNPNGTHYYEVRPLRDWLEQAQYDAEQDPKWQGDNATPARKWRAVKVER